MTDFAPAEGLPKPTDWMTRMLASAIASDVGRMALDTWYETGKNTVTVNYSFSKNESPEEDYTCDKCREHHPAGLNVAVWAIGDDVPKGYATITNPVEMMEWASIVVNVGLCHRCWVAEGYPHSALADLDPGFVQQAVRLIQSPPQEVYAS
jgi:hypothetical protein